MMAEDRITEVAQVPPGRVRRVVTDFVFSGLSEATANLSVPSLAYESPELWAEAVQAYLDRHGITEITVRTDWPRVRLVRAP